VVGSLLYLAARAGRKREERVSTSV
jgi:hypothetical protein